MKICPTCKQKFEDNIHFCPHDSEVLEPDLTSLVDTILDGQYHIEAVLGQGGMGAVYRARHTLLNDRVAIKILSPHLSNNPGYKRRFLREGQAARRFHHPNAVTVHDLRTTSDGTIYMVLEYVEGNTLGEELKKRGRFSPTEAFALLKPIAEALHAAHAMGVVHRDLKPDNIMISAYVNNKSLVKLLDLGIAKVSKLPDVTINTEATALTVTGQIIGTPHYMSPEQWEGTEEIDGRTDIYSLGLVFYELIAGYRPFEGKTLQDLARQHAMIKPPALHEIVKSVPEAFSRVIMRAIAKSPHQRQATMEKFINELQATLPAKAGDSTGFEDATLIVPHDSQVPTITANASTISVTPVTAPTDAIPQRITEDASARATKVDISLESQLPLSRRLIWPMAASVIVLLLAIGGWLVWQQRSLQMTGNNIKPISDVGVTAVNPPAVEMMESMRYWIEIASPLPGGPSIRKAGSLMLASNDSLKLHFLTREFGYLYIVGAGAGNAPTTFLTAKPDPKSGLNTNTIKVGEEFSFPKGEENWLTLDKNATIDKCTIIFSAIPLHSPAFLNAPAGHELTPEEHKQWVDFRAQAVLATTTLMAEQEPYVVINVPKQGVEGKPIIFDVVVDHK
ncbi:MAG: serine/threonine-protein kinase [Acidobacteriota bacterium]